jgi:hypothetical protein
MIRTETRVRSVDSIDSLICRIRCRNATFIPGRPRVAAMRGESLFLFGIVVIIPAAGRHNLCDNSFANSVLCPKFTE